MRFLLKLRTDAVLGFGACGVCQRWGHREVQLFSPGRNQRRLIGDAELDFATMVLVLLSHGVGTFGAAILSNDIGTFGAFATMVAKQR
jgi:hypothetical protein